MGDEVRNMILFSNAICSTHPPTPSLLFVGRGRRGVIFIKTHPPTPSLEKGGGGEA